MMLSSTTTAGAINRTASSPSNSLCEETGSPSSIHSQHSNRELTTSSHSLKNDTSSDDPTDFSTAHANDDTNSSTNVEYGPNIEIHPQNQSLSSSSRQQFIKRPLNAYMIWTRQERKRILSADPKMKMNEVSKAIQMGEKWKKMTDKEKKPYFEIARKYALEHKQALQDHPELTYAPSKKKGPKSGSGASNTDHNMQQQITPTKLMPSGNAERPTISAIPYSQTPPNPSPRSSTPRQILTTTTPQSIQQPSTAFVPFQNPLSTGTMQIAHVLGVRPPAASQLITGNAYQVTTPPTTPVSGTLLLQPQGAFSQPQPRTSLGVPVVVGGARSTPGQMLDLYYTSLCQPAFPNISESPVNTLSMYPPQYLLEQYSQLSQQQQQQQQGGSNTHF